MSASIEQFQERIAQTLGPVETAHQQLAEHDENVDYYVNDLDNKNYELQKAISVVVDEKVLTPQYLASQGYPLAVGRNKVKVDVEEKHVELSELGEYISNVFNTLANLKSQADAAREDLDRIKEAREPYYEDFALAVGDALDSDVVTRAQIKAFVGTALPSASVIKKYQDKASGVEETAQETTVAPDDQ